LCGHTVSWRQSSPFPPAPSRMQMYYVGPNPGVAHTQTMPWSRSDDGTLSQDPADIKLPASGGSHA